MTGKTFADIHEELAYYKAQTTNLQLELEDTRASLEEFQQTSRELEEDLERELETVEKRCKDLRAKNEALKNEVDDWKQKFYQSKQESNVNQTQMQRELDSLRALRDKYAEKTRNLELENDDLERTERLLSAPVDFVASRTTLQDLESKYNKAIERGALLEEELEGKAQLIVQVQRLKDDLRDANIELAVLKNKQDGDLGPPSTPAVQRHYSRPPSAMSIDSSSGVTTANPVRMVQEMVGRVKSLEARLVSCRSLVTPLLAPPPSYSTTVPYPASSPSPPLITKEILRTKSVRRARG
ncbi:2117_t:CDS:2 [Paraglomus occultum]|uniref:2117_t:CDS:1 n=1 Tax=Paraglomus occultum TaxID=144539 RepID=A0A9N9FTX9_9GLOM|nr:2117_t:CDS:2 [Paraglomus occultum]